MDQQELIKEIKEEFTLLKPGTAAAAIESGIRVIIRQISHFKNPENGSVLKLNKIAADLMSLYKNQVQYSELKNKSENPGLNVKPEFDGSFFTSLAILREELLQLLEKI